MTFSFFINFVIISFIAAVSTGWEHHRGPIVAREEPREYAAWYQMPQGAAAYPPTAYERAVAASAAASQYAGYPRPYSRSPDYYPETAVTNNMVPSGRKAAAAGYYIPASNTQDTYQISAIDRYFPLLGRKRINNSNNKKNIISGGNLNTFGSRKRQTTFPPKIFASTPSTLPNAASVMKTLKPRRPLIETWKCVKKPCPRLSTLKPMIKSGGRTKMIRPNKKQNKLTTTTTLRPENVNYKTFATVEGIKLASVKPYTFRPRHKQSNRKIVKVSTILPNTLPSATVTVVTISPTSESAGKITKSTPSTTLTPSSTVPPTTTKSTTTTPKVLSTTTTNSPSTITTPTSTSTTAKKLITEVTKRREIRPKIITQKTFKPLSLIKVTPFTTFKPKTFSTNIPSTSSSTLPSTLTSSIETTSKSIDFPYSLLWPNAELISAIKDVVRKFKASLDRTGVQDDVRQMSTQLESTWNDLRRGKLESWIERAQQMLADSVSEDDVKALLEAQKGNQKIAKNPAAIFPKEKPNKSSNVIKAEKINPKFNNEFNHTK